jgi:hypothetical protein
LDNERDFEEEEIGEIEYETERGEEGDIRGGRRRK